MLTINDLSVEVLLKTFENLDLKTLKQVSQSSKRFQEILQRHPYLWIKALNRLDEKAFHDILLNKRPLLTLYENKQDTHSVKKPLTLLAYQHQQFITQKLINTTSLRFSQQTPFNGHTDWVSCLEWLSDERFASGSADGTIKIWDLTTGKCILTLQGHILVRSLILLSDGRLASGYLDGTIKIWNLTTGECVRTMRSHIHTVISFVQLSKEQLISVSVDRIATWNLGTGRCEKTVVGNRKGGIILHFSNGRLAGTLGEGIINIWDLDTIQPVQTLQENHVKYMVGLPNKQLLTIPVNNTAIKIWDLKTGQCVQTFYEHTSWVKSYILLPGGRFTTSYENIIKIWDIRSGKRVDTIQMSDKVTALSYSQGQLLVGLRSGMIKRFDFAEVALESLYTPRRSARLAQIEFQGQGSAKKLRFNG